MKTAPPTVEACVIKVYDDNPIVHLTIDWNQTICGREILNNTEPRDEIATCKVCTNTKRIDAAMRRAQLAHKLFEMGDPIVAGNLWTTKQVKDNLHI